MVKGPAKVKRFIHVLRLFVGCSLVCSTRYLLFNLSDLRPPLATQCLGLPQGL